MKIIETVAIFIIQSILWHFLPWSDGLSKWQVTVAYLSLFCIAFGIVAALEMAYEGITGKEIPD